MNSLFYSKFRNNKYIKATLINVIIQYINNKIQKKLYINIPYFESHWRKVFEEFFFLSFLSPTTLLLLIYQLSSTFSFHLSAFSSQISAYNSPQLSAFPFPFAVVLCPFHDLDDFEIFATSFSRRTSSCLLLSPATVSVLKLNLKR